MLQENGAFIFKVIKEVLSTAGLLQFILMIKRRRQHMKGNGKYKRGIFSNWNFIYPYHWVITYQRHTLCNKSFFRLLDAGNAMIYKRKINFKDPSSFPKDIKYVFVETKLLPDVLHLRKMGIHVLSPDYIPEFIIQVNIVILIPSLSIHTYSV